MLHGAPGDGKGSQQTTRPPTSRRRSATPPSCSTLSRPTTSSSSTIPRPPGSWSRFAPPGARVWRCHVGADTPTTSCMRLGRSSCPVIDADRIVFSRAAFVWEGLDRSRVNVIPPSIDAFTPKNSRSRPARSRRSCAPAAYTTDRRTAGRRTAAWTAVRAGRPLGGAERLARAARAGARVGAGVALGPAQGPAGVLRAFVEGIAPSTDAHLVLAGPSTAAVADDPEGPPSSPRSPLRRMACLRSCARGPPVLFDGRSAGERDHRQRPSAPR